MWYLFAILALVLALIGNNWITVTRYVVTLDVAQRGTEIAQAEVAEAGQTVGADDRPMRNEDDRSPALRILQLSDLHGKRFGIGSWRLMRRIRGLDYDIVAVTGDAITGGVLPRGAHAALSVIEKLAARTPVYVVAGNHEATSRQFPALEQRLRSIGVAVLRRESVAVSRGGRSFALLGLEDPRFFGQGKRWKQRKTAAFGEYARGLAALAASTTNLRPRILLAHRPELLDVYARAGVDLVLTGHVHGGQFRIPGVGGLFAPDQGFFPRFDAGVFRRGTTQMVVSRGLGPSIVPLRVFNRPEVVLIEVHER